MIVFKNCLKNFLASPKKTKGRPYSHTFFFCSSNLILQNINIVALFKVPELGIAYFAMDIIPYDIQTIIFCCFNFIRYDSDKSVVYFWHGIILFI